jgi:hypothetical protein
MFTVGVFQDVVWANRGIAALVDDGFDPASLSVIAKTSDESDALFREKFGETAQRLEVKRLGIVSLRGPLVATLQGSDRALESSGLGEVCGRAGFQRHDAHIYETLIGRGGVLVAVHNFPRAADALAKLHAFGGGNAAIGAWAGRV